MGITIGAIKRMVEAGLSDEDIQAYLDGWAKPVPCLECEARRATDRERVKRYRNAQKKGLPHTPSKENTSSSCSDKESSQEVFPWKVDIEWAVNEWNELAEDAGLPAVRQLTAQRKKALQARLRELGSREAWTDALMTISRTPFCCGENDRGWRANFDFVLRPSAMVRLLEGNYGKI